jgi:hypothetical protein
LAVVTVTSFKGLPLRVSFCATAFSAALSAISVKIFLLIVVKFKVFTMSSQEIKKNGEIKLAFQ